VSKVLGHVSIKTTEIHAKVLDKLVAEQMKGVEKRLQELSDGGKIDNKTQIYCAIITY
jgi:hypothetical protein